MISWYFSEMFRISYFKEHLLMAASEIIWKRCSDSFHSTKQSFGTKNWEFFVRCFPGSFMFAGVLRAHKDFVTFSGKP